MVGTLLRNLHPTDPSAATFFQVPADVAYACQQSVPLVKQDAFDLLKGLKAWAEWQSTIVLLESPPDYWPRKCRLIPTREKRAFADESTCLFLHRPAG
jgi:hypothetical protein